MQAGHRPVPQVVQAVSGVVGMEASGRTLCREATGGSQSEASPAAATELMSTLRAGEVETSSSAQTEDGAAAWALDGGLQQGGADLVLLLLPNLELLTGEFLMLGGPS